ncbi:hypothetical protein C0Q70_02792 [Pomacea canaliculata]|uniref:beta-mannosidase n=1 Tax=Pomacea canaliculata TaxID=400727 RepID=A0A2T7PQX0_POMCA|nr:hypothetical protein C0Q70_02792 [Pomacea canaliculata]
MSVAGVITVALCCLRVAHAYLTISLNGTWTVSNQNIGLSVPGQVPGSVHTALMANDAIADPLYRDNDVKLTWIGNVNWTYSRDFEVNNSVLKSQAIQLVAEGLDTIATVYINGIMVGKSDNMFVKYTFDVKSALKPLNNSIVVSFQSAVDYAAKQAAQSQYPIPPVCPSAVQNGQCHVNFIRKEQCSFSWDWGPSFPTQGIWKSIYLTAFDSSIIEEVTVDHFEGSDGWTLEVRVFFNLATNTSGIGGMVELQILEVNGSEPGNMVLSSSQAVMLSSFSRTLSLNITLPKDYPIKRWWPNGYGNQSLYDVIVTYTSTVTGEVTTKVRRIGFRTVELVQTNVSRDPLQGLTFYFRINGLPVFLKGTNWIPADSFQERITKDRLRILLQSAADAHINSMRVWGGGVYESEDFYDLTDELGIMIWQDLMFSDALYPSNPDFLNSVTQEIQYQTRRLMHRPSILLWSGNNENEGILTQRRSAPNYELYYDDYIKLYIDTVMTVLQQENPRRQFVPSSPSDGAETVKEGYVAQNPYSDLYGDVHFYDYNMDQWKPDGFPIPRMTTEFGLQSWCNFDTLLDVFEEEDLSYYSDQAVHREHHQGGLAQMANETFRHLNTPQDDNPVQLFKSLIYMTQISQAMSIKTQSEHYRRHQSELLSDGRGLTMGALYWQLNDIWQAPTWASIDYSGRWKMLHYYALRFFNPLMVSPVLNGSTLDIYVVMDEIPSREVRDPVTGNLRFEPSHTYEDGGQAGEDPEDLLRLQRRLRQSGVVMMKIYSWSSFTPLFTWRIEYSLNTTADSVFQGDVSTLLSQAGCHNGTECFLYVHLDDVDYGLNNWLSFAELKDSSLQKAEVTVGTAVRDTLSHLVT